MRLHRLFAVAAAALALTGLNSAALAQKMDVLVLNQGELVQNSKAGQSIASQIQALAQTASAEMQGEAQKLQNEGQALQASKDSMSQEDLQKRAQALMAKQQGTQRLGQIKEAEIAQAEAAALQQLSQRVEPIVEQIAKKRRAKVVLRRVDVAWLDEDADITDEVIAALDQQVATIKVTKPDLIAQARAAAAQQQQQ
ncbi:OmpH family outer membrane protein [Parvularcula oceani]|uniref:OmpH family outer membrane protein n=1 Tax=Parvularcula oceani TaxID=1247963 RepID=UPI0004E11F8D|nr:OmpH family outer membrane protein [Parvularcula oceani]